MKSTSLYTLSLKKAGCVSYAVRECSGAADVVTLARAAIGMAATETLIAIMLNGRNQVVGVHVVAIGGMHGISVVPRDIFKAAIVANASAIVLSHNHPSGDPRPSPEDMRFTKAAKDAAAILGIAIVDHVIVTSTEDYYSMFEHGTF